MVDPLQGWRARKWSNALLDKCRSALRGGHLFDASRAVLLRHMLVCEMEGKEEAEVQALVPTVGRLLASSAAQLHELGQLGSAIIGVLECATHEEHKQKVCSPEP